jgi:hypothetical protein
MAHKAAQNADGVACSVNFGHERIRSSRDVVLI